MRKSSILLLLTFSVFYSSPSLAFEGDYRSGSQAYRQVLKIKKQGDSYTVELVVGTRGCSGSFDGIGPVEGAKLVVKTTSKEDANDKCVVSISRKGLKLDVDEDDCGYWHGASCEFPGTYSKR